ncbi:hypothetical protein HPB49_017770 [Dermacentor silvarum]|uniref:Uncharacterized protein n=1 Tax=Dermacentor silvarum TaxID=543639 RepID=A0ACB8CAP4_DERSI|nr:hypothetical protein HPB49_017770 [Dermacentor silvarum]
MKLFTLKTTNGSKAFCSELCFTQCRRASFKKNKVCDWCKHVRHTVNYVDFQDGEQQLQFCSDKCLNQYKMNIFCRETQAHLQMHPHLQDAAAACKVASGLITPDLWLRDCKSSQPSGASNGHDDSSEREDDHKSPPPPPPVLPALPPPPLSSSAPPHSRPSQPSPDSGASGDPVNLSQKPTHTKPSSSKRRRSLRSSRSSHASSSQDAGGVGSSSSGHNHQAHTARSPTRATSTTPLSSPGASGSSTHHLNDLGQRYRTREEGRFCLLHIQRSTCSLQYRRHPTCECTVTLPLPLQQLLARPPHVPPMRAFLPPPPHSAAGPPAPTPPTGVVPPMGLHRQPPLALPPAPNPLLPPPTVMVPYPIFGSSSEHRHRRHEKRRQRRLTPEHEDMRDSVDTEDEGSPGSRSSHSCRAAARHGASTLQLRIVRSPPVLDQDNKRALDEEDEAAGRDAKRKCPRD